MKRKNNVFLLVEKKIFWISFSIKIVNDTGSSIPYSFFILFVYSRGQAITVWVQHLKPKTVCYNRGVDRLSIHKTNHVNYKIKRNLRRVRTNPTAWYKKVCAIASTTLIIIYTFGLWRRFEYKWKCIWTGVFQRKIKAIYLTDIKCVLLRLYDFNFIIFYIGCDFYDCTLYKQIERMHNIRNDYLHFYFVTSHYIPSTDYRACTEFVRRKHKKRTPFQSRSNIVRCMHIAHKGLTFVLRTQ